MSFKEWIKAKSTERRIYTGIYIYAQADFERHSSRVQDPEGRSSSSVVSNMATRAQVLSLYRMLLREGGQFPAYNYR